MTLCISYYFDAEGADRCYFFTLNTHQIELEYKALILSL